jgi:hypothetical protein
LARRGFEADVAVRGDALVVHDHRQAALVTFRVIVLAIHHVDARPFEIFVRVELEAVGRQGRERCECDQQQSAHEFPFVRTAW